MISLRSPLMMEIFPSRFSLSSFSATWNLSVDVLVAREGISFIHSWADSSIEYSKSILELTSIVTSPP